jgi:hypothetical protein
VLERDDDAVLDLSLHVLVARQRVPVQRQALLVLLENLPASVVVIIIIIIIIITIIITILILILILILMAAIIITVLTSAPSFLSLAMGSADDAGGEGGAITTRPEVKIE